MRALPGIVTGLHVACRAIGGGAFTATPVYPPFLSASERLATAPLRRGEERWEWDLAAVEAAIAEGATLLVLTDRGVDKDRAPIPALLATAEGRLDGIALEWSDDPALCVVMAAKGYPGDYPKGDEISGLEQAAGFRDEVVDVILGQRALQARRHM